MRGRTHFRSIVFLLVVFTQSLIAHHGSLEFDHSRTVSVMGKLTKLDWNNPHAFAYVEVTKDGAKESWSGEIGPPNLHIKLGWTPEGVRSLIGQTVTMTGNPAKDRSNRIQSQILKTEKGAVLSLQIKAENVRVENGVLVVVPN